MAGTRLAAQTYFLVFSLVSVLVAWRLGVVSRSPLPLKRMASLTSSSLAVLPVDIDLVILRNAGHGSDCRSCAAVLDAATFDPSLARNAFLLAQAAQEEEEQSVQQAGDGAYCNTDHAGEMVEEQKQRQQHQPLFSVRDINVRVVNVANSGKPAPPASKPEELAAWLLNLVHRQRSPNNSTSSLRYTFFVGCGGIGQSSELPIFTMSKHRHGYLGLGCGCVCDVNNEESAAVDGYEDEGNSATRIGTTPPGEEDEPGSETCQADGANLGANSRETMGAAARAAASTAAFVMFQTLAGIVVAHVLRSPVSAGDVHVRLGQAYRLNFSLMSEDPGLRRCTWDFAGASRRYLRPLLRKLEPVASFAVQSQVVHHARLSPSPPRAHSAKRRWYYSPQDLEGFLGANDFSILDLDAAWGAAGEHSSSGCFRSAGDNTTSDHIVCSPHSQVTVNFMVFCPSPTYSPLVFMEEWVGADGAKKPAAEAYEVPGFGGVSVVNGFGSSGANGANDQPTDAAATDVVDVVDPERIRRALGSHASQLRRIIGLPRQSDRPSEAPWPRTLLVGRENDGTAAANGMCAYCPATQYRLPTKLPVTFLPSLKDGMTDWEVDTLVRAALARNRRAAAETLRSLAALVESSPEMEISGKIAEDVNAAIAALSMADVVILREISGAADVRRGLDAALAGSGEARLEYVGASKGERNTIGEREQHNSDAAPHGSGKSDCASCASGAHSDSACEYDAGRRALYWAREALRRSEAAYFDPTMVPQLYFPQDHIMAVYLPFLGPLAFPLLWGFAQELWRYRKKRRAKKERLERERKERTEGTGFSKRERHVAAR